MPCSGASRQCPSQVGEYTEQSLKYMLWHGHIKQLPKNRKHWKVCPCAPFNTFPYFQREKFTLFRPLIGRIFSIILSFLKLDQYALKTWSSHFWYFWGFHGVIPQNFLTIFGRKQIFNFVGLPNGHSNLHRFLSQIFIQTQKEQLVKIVSKFDYNCKVDRVQRFSPKSDSTLFLLQN